MKKVVLITGASSGIGRETAILLAKNNYDLILVARRLELLKEISNEILSMHKDIKVEFYETDIRDKSDIKKLTEKIQGKRIDVLINNAGLALGLNPFYEGDENDWENMIDTNIKGLINITKALLPNIPEKTGHIINISSIAGKFTYAGNNFYCATKYAVESISQTFRIDLLKKGIKVTNISPGATETEFSIVRFKGDKAKAKNVYEGFMPLNGQDIAEVILFVITRPLHVNINDITIMPTAQANPFYLEREK